MKFSHTLILILILILIHILILILIGAGRKMCKQDHVQLLAPLGVAKSQAWNRRVESPLPKELKPISTRLSVRTEFTGAGTAEEAFQSAAVLYNKSTPAIPINVDVKSIGDWSKPARNLATLNQPDACQFGDIMGLAPDKLREKLEATCEEKASFVDSRECTIWLWRLNLNIVATSSSSEVSISASELRASMGYKKPPSAKTAEKAVGSLFLVNGSFDATSALRIYCESKSQTSLHSFK